MSDIFVVSETRRKFLSGALVLGFTIPLAAGKLRAASLVEGGALAPRNSAAPWQPNGFIRIDEHGITLIIPNVEMGQGIYTAEAMLMAEELEIDLDQMQIEPAPANPAIYTTALLKFQGTGGSTSIRSWWEPLRKAGAAAKSMLVAAAAARWEVDPASCHAERGSIVHAKSGRRLAYTALAADASRFPTPTDVTLKHPSKFRLVGKSQRRLDSPAKVNGTAMFGIDIRVPGMKVAVVNASPVFGGTLGSLDSAAALTIPGVIRVLAIDNAVAIVADNTWAAMKGAKALKIVWNEGINAGLTTDIIREQLTAASKDGKPIVAVDEGDAAEALDEGSRRIEATDDLPFLAHAAMEPINTLVHVQPDGCDIWCGTQVPSFAAAYASKVTGLPLDKIRVHNQLIGGGFGRRLEADSIGQATAFAKQVDYPLQVIWTREEDIRHDYYRPMYHDRISAALGAGGLPSALWHRTTGASVLARYAPAAMSPSGLDRDAVEGSAEIPYAIPRRLVEWVRQDLPPHVSYSWWRGVGPAHNVFVIESFIDELAQAAGQDAIGYRREMLAHNPRALAVLNLAAEKADWDKKLPLRSGRGVSLHQSFGSFCALVIDIDVSPQGEIRMKQVTAAIDCGYTVNPDTVIAQIQGGAIFGLSAALFSGIEIQNGRTVQSNFHDYRILRINEAPRLSVHQIINAEEPGGIGEVATVSAAPALANAIFAATGVRLRRLPLDQSKLKLEGADSSVIGSLAPPGIIGMALLARELSPGTGVEDAYEIEGKIQ